uniref:Uncharacterized protein n=1 Tax=Glossina brevipalpis TaxID=37001 RepID=A0A1A9WVG1_9MUSC
MKVKKKYYAHYGYHICFQKNVRHKTDDRKNHKTIGILLKALMCPPTLSILDVVAPQKSFCLYKNQNLLIVLLLCCYVILCCFGQESTIQESTLHYISVFISFRRFQQYYQHR